MENFKNKKVLIWGLGILGGGVSAVKWFYKRGAELRITDLKKRKDLESSIKKLKNIRAKYLLGKHRKKDFDWADIIFANPGVSYKNELVKYAKEKNKEIVNDCYLFFKYSKGDVIAVTGTRGKTTTTTWIYELIKANLNSLIQKNGSIFLGGNQPEKSLFKILEKTKENSLSVLELSSFQLEFYEKGLRAPKIAIITNIYNDHLNRYSSFEEYASMKAKIFQNQKEDDYLILNYDNSWTKFFLNFKPKSRVYFVSFKKLLKRLKGAYIHKEIFYIRDEKEIKVMNIKKFSQIYGEHNVYNLLLSFLASYLYLKSKYKDVQYLNIIENLKKRIFSLKTPELRQQIIYQSKNLTIVNDSAGTSPDATIMAIKRFKNNIILITGGTDKNLDFKELAKIIKKYIDPENLILLNGSATKKLINELEEIKYKPKYIFEDLKDCIKKGFENINLKRSHQDKVRKINTKIHSQSYVILFSPGSASFEKFKNEFDRGRKFNKIIKRIIKKES